MIIFLGVAAILVTIFMSQKTDEIDEGDKYDAIFQQMAVKYGVPEWKWLKAIAKQESDIGRDKRVKNGQVSYDGKSWGIMQIAPDIGSQKEIELKGPNNPEMLNNPFYSIEIGAKLVGYLWQQFKDKDKVFLAYNQGEIHTRNGKNYTLATTPPYGYDVKINKHLENLK